MNPTATLTLDRLAVRLSDPVKATLTVTGPAPLVVQPPEPLLVAPATEAWASQPAGPATVARNEDGTETWTRTYVLDPYRTGSEVPVVIGPLTVSAGGVSHRLEVSAVSASVTTSITDPLPSAARPAAPPEEPPALPDGEAWIWAIAVGVVVILAAVVVGIRRRKLAVIPPPPVGPRLDALAAELANGTRTPLQFAAAVADEVRRAVQTRFPVPADRRTTAELLAAATDVPAAELRLVLSAGDRAKFAEIGPESCDELLAAARAVVGRANL